MSKDKPRKPPANIRAAGTMPVTHRARPDEETNANKRFVVRDKDWAAVWGSGLDWATANKLKQRVVNRRKSHNARVEEMPTDPELLAFCTFAEVQGDLVEMTPEVLAHVERLQAMIEVGQIPEAAPAAPAPKPPLTPAPAAAAPISGPARDSHGLLLDGPTMEEWTAAGYPREGYPPAGWAARPSPALEAYRIERAAKAAEDLVAAQPKVTASECPPHDFQPDPLGKCTKCKRTDQEILEQGLLEEDAMGDASVEDLIG